MSQLIFKELKKRVSLEAVTQQQSRLTETLHNDVWIEFLVIIRNHKAWAYTSGSRSISSICSHRSHIGHTVICFETISRAFP